MISNIFDQLKKIIKRIFFVLKIRGMYGGMDCGMDCGMDGGMDRGMDAGWTVPRKTVTEGGRDGNGRWTGR